MIGVQTGKEKEKACERKRKTADNQNYRNHLFCFGEQGRV